MTKTIISGYDVHAQMLSRSNGDKDSIYSIVRCNAQFGADRCKKEYKTAVAQRRAYYNNAIATLGEAFGIRGKDAVALVKALYKTEYDNAKRQAH